MSVEVKEEVDKEGPEAEAMTDTAREDIRTLLTPNIVIVAQDLTIAEITEAEVDLLPEEEVTETEMTDLEI